MIARILIAAIPVTVMLVIEVVLPYWRRRRDVPSRQDESVQTRGDIASMGNDDDAAACRVDGERSTKRWRQDGHYYRVLHQAAHAGHLSSMDRLGELALARKDFVEAFYWKLSVELRHGQPSGLSARGVCRAWRNAGCPKSNTDEGGLFTESQKKLSMAALDLCSGRHRRAPEETIRRMLEEGDEDARLYARHFGIGGSKS